MKFILSFFATGVLLSASTCFNLNVGNAATNFNALCNPVNVPVANTEPVKCATPIVTQPTIECNLPVVAKCDPPVVTKCTPVPVVSKPEPTPVIECPKPGAPTAPKCNPTPSSATPEPASFALMGFSFVAVGAIHKFRKSC